MEVELLSVPKQEAVDFAAAGSLGCGGGVRA